MQKVFLAVMVLLVLLQLLSTGKIANPLSLLSLVLPIILIYQVSKKTIKGYQTARTWLIILFIGFFGVTQLKIDNQHMVFDIITYLVVIGIYVVSFFLINSICKELALQNTNTDSADLNKKVADVSSQNVSWQTIKKPFFIILGIIVLMILFSIFSK